MASISDSVSVSDSVVLRDTSPKRDWLRVFSILVGLVGLAITAYLTYTKLANVEQFCATNEAFNCELVQNTDYSRLFGIPIQFLGLGGYVAILGALTLEGRILSAKNTMIAVFGMTLFGFMYSAYLTAIEAFVIHAWCMWCLGSAATMTTLFGLSGARLWREISKPIELLDDEETETVP